MQTEKGLHEDGEQCIGLLTNKTSILGGVYCVALLKSQ